MKIEHQDYDMKRPTGQLAALLELNDVTKEQLRDTAHRSALAEALLENGIMRSREDCHNFVEALAQYAAGIPLSAEMSAWINMAKAGIAQWIKIEEARGSAWQQQGALDRLAFLRLELLENIKRERQFVEQLADVRANALRNYRESVVGIPTETADHACSFGKDIVGAREGRLFLEQDVIPALEKEIADLDQQIAAHKAAITTA